MMIYWCELCQANPSNGTLTIIRDGETMPEDVQACSHCVLKLEDDEWL